MEWSGAVERNREALKRLLSSLAAMAGLGPEVRAAGEPTLPRHLHRAILRLLRPAEAAARRLIIVMARGMKPPRSRSSAMDHTPTRSAFGAATSPQGGGGAAAPLSPSPLWGGVRGGGQNKSPRTLALPLLDPLRLPRLRRPTSTAVPRISLPGYTLPFPIPVPQPPSSDDMISAARLGLRLKALAAALDDMPRHALRFARWQMRRDRARDQGLVHRVGPLRPGRPPGGRLKRWDPNAPPGRNIREVDEILAHAHELARTALEQKPDTS